MSTAITFECNGERATRLAQRGLEGQGLQVERSFDLPGADSDACGCRYHGTPLCTCQYSVLLVYPAAGAPAVVTAHGRESRTRLEIVVDPNSAPDSELVEQIRQTLAGISQSLRPAAPAPQVEAGASLI
jgi:hypothetical protein